MSFLPYHTVLYLQIYRVIDLMGQVFSNGPRSLIPDLVIPKTQKMVLDTSLLNTQHYKVRIKGKVEHGISIKLLFLTIKITAIFILKDNPNIT